MSSTTIYRMSLLLVGILVLFYETSVVAVSPIVVMDASGSLKLQNIPSSIKSDQLIAMIVSPDTPSAASLSKSTDDSNSILNLDPSACRLTCRGPTLSVKSSDPECVSVALCSLTAVALVLDGITTGDVEAGFKNSRHAVTLTALFRTKATLAGDAAEESDNITDKQALVLYVEGDVSEKLEKQIRRDVLTLYDAAAAESKDVPSFDKAYELQIVSTESQSESQLMTTISEAASAVATTGKPLGLALQDAQNKIQKWPFITSGALDPPQIASAFVVVGDAHSRQTRSARAKLASWKSRTARGLLVDGFGKDAEQLYKKTLSTFDAETLSAAGLPTVAAYRAGQREQLQSLVKGAIRDSFQAQVANLEKRTMKKFRAKLLKHVNNNNMDEAATAIDNNAAALRAATFGFETAMEDLSVPSLGLTKEGAVRAMTAKLNDELMSFADSPAAKLKRAKQVKKVVSKERKPSQRAIDFGLDLVAMIRPDGFGSLQGFAGYQLGGNSLTVGLHNDADDPQVISQFGGVRPPLLRVQPKLRVDVEL